MDSILNKIIRLREMKEITYVYVYVYILTVFLMEALILIENDGFFSGTHVLLDLISFLVANFRKEPDL